MQPNNPSNPSNCPSPTGCTFPNQLSSSTFVYQSESSKNLQTYCVPFCSVGQSSFQNVLNSTQDIYQIMTPFSSINNNSYIAIPFVAQNNLPSYFSFILSQGPLGNFIGSNSNNSFSTSNTNNMYRINLLGGTTIQYPGNFTLGSFGNYISLVKDGDDRTFASSTNSSNYQSLQSLQFPILTQNIQQVFYLNFNDNGNGGTSVTITLQQNDNVVDLFSQGQNPITYSFVIDVSLEELESYTMYVALSSNNPSVNIFDYAFYQYDALCSYYYPGIGGLSEFQLNSINSVTIPSFGALNQTFNNNNNVQTLTHISNRFQGILSTNSSFPSNFSVNLITSITTSTSIQYTDCPPYSINNQNTNNANNLLRFVIGGGPDPVGNLGTSTLIALTNGNDPNANNSLQFTNPISTAQLYAFDAIVLEDISIGTNTGTNSMAMIKITSQAPGNIVPNSTNIYNGQASGQFTFSDNTSELSSSQTRAGMFNLANMPAQMSVLSMNYQCGLLNRESDGLTSASVSDTAYFQQVPNSNSNSNSPFRFLTVQFQYEPNGTSGSFGFVLQNLPIIQATGNKNSTLPYNPISNSCFLPAFKWMCFYGSENEGVAISDGNDANIVYQPANNYTTSFSSALASQGNSNVLVTVIIDFENLTAFTYFGPMYTNNTTESHPFVVTLPSPAQADVQVIDTSGALGVHMFHWNYTDGSIVDNSAKFAFDDFGDSLNLIDPNYNPYDAFVQCPNNVSTNVCRLNFDPISLQKLNNDINLYGTVGYYSPQGASQMQAVQSKTPLRKVVQQIGNSASSIQFNGNSPNLCPNGVDFCVPEYATDNELYALNMSMSYSPVPTPLMVTTGYDKNSNPILAPDFCGQYCMNASLMGSGATGVSLTNSSVIPGLGQNQKCQDSQKNVYTNCYDYMTNLYTTTQIPNLAEVLKGNVYKNPSATYFGGPMNGLNSCAFTGACFGYNDYIQYCPNSNDNDGFNSKDQLDPYSLGVPCASYLQSTFSNQQVNVPFKYACNIGSTGLWDYVYQTNFYCSSPKETGTIPLNQFGIATAPPPLGIGTSPITSTFELCGPLCTTPSTTPSSLPYGWGVTCTELSFAGLSGFLTQDQTGTGGIGPFLNQLPNNTNLNNSITGCAVNFTFSPANPNPFSIQPTLCLSRKNNLGLDMQVNPDTNFTSDNFYAVSTFALDQSKPVSFYWYNGNNSSLPACDYTNAPTGPSCPDIYESFDGWNYAQMIPSTSMAGLSFANVPVAKNLYSQQLQDTCDQPPFPALF